MGTPVCNVCGVAARGLVGKSVDGEDNRHKKCGDQALVVLADLEKGQKKSAQIAEGKEKSAARKEVTGRYRQGNHDSLTKPNVRGGAKGDRHDHGRRQNGSAGEKGSG
ncbi:hypothetical protein EC912_102193 [Luteibacter rhizovicinus]|uniref:Uncharacterized protein n=1 Tax=Luteibacter rhizovicinus TaxID=242606 RepID=A0A4R3YVK3_9GAMM|nr:hypothetical protein EC912_102193 [Luteibacter rhizovicinus]